MMIALAALAIAIVKMLQIDAQIRNLEGSLREGIRDQDAYETARYGKVNMRDLSHLSNREVQKIGQNVRDKIKRGEQPSEEEWAAYRGYQKREYGV